jgi:transposase
VNKEELIAINRTQKEQINLLQKQNKLLEKDANDFKILLSNLQQQHDHLIKLIYEHKSERFISNITPEQLSVFARDPEEGIEPACPVGRKAPQPIEVAKHKRYKSKPHPGRTEIPDHLPTEDIIIEPEENTEGLKKIGEEVTETLKYIPAGLVRVRTIRYKYEKPDGNGILIGDLPARPINKGIAEASLLSHILVSKFVDHCVLCVNVEWIKTFKAVLKMRAGPSESTCRSWFQTSACCII